MSRIRINRKSNLVQAKQLFDSLEFQELRSILVRLLPPDQRPVVVYSGIYSISRIFSSPREELPGKILDMVLDVTGSRTLLMPTYTNGYT